MLKRKKLEEQIQKLPPKPGVYLFKNNQGKVIYIGKALSLKHRLKSYFKEKPQGPKTKSLVDEIANFDILKVACEFEALLLEAKLIKEYQPKYNSQLKDDKRYLYIAITKAPYRVFAIRRPDLQKDLLDWYGPFPSSKDVRRVLRSIRKVFPYCSCKKPPKRECFYSHINLCPGYKKLSSSIYKKSLEKIRQILSGKSSLLTKELKKKMKQAAKKLEFEKAANYKKQLEALFYVTQSWRTVSCEEPETTKSLLSLRKLLATYQGIEPTTLRKIEAYDVSNLGKDIIVGSLVVFIDGQAEKGLYRKFRIRPNLFNDPHCSSEALHQTVRGEVESSSTSSGQAFRLSLPQTCRETRKTNDPAAINQIISRRLNHPEWLYPQLILVDGGKPQASAAFRAIKKKGLSGQICLLGLAKKEETIIVPRIKNKKIASWKQLKYSHRSSVLRLLMKMRDESHRFAHKYYQKLHSKKIF